MGPGWGECVMFLGGSLQAAAAASALSGGVMQIPALLATSNACVRFGGMTATVLPVNVGIAAYIGCLQ